MSSARQFIFIFCRPLFNNDGELEIGESTSIYKQVRSRQKMFQITFLMAEILCAFWSILLLPRSKLSARISTWTILSVFVLQDREKLSDEEVIKLLSNYSAT